MLNILLIGIEPQLVRGVLPPTYSLMREDEIKLDSKMDVVVLSTERESSVPLARLYVLMKYDRTACVVVISDSPSLEEESIALRAGAQDYVALWDIERELHKAVKKAYERCQFQKEHSIGFVLGGNIEDEGWKRLEAISALVRLASRKHSLLSRGDNRGGDTNGER